MHEAALAAPLLRLVLEETGRHARVKGLGLRVTRITVRAGLLMAVEAPTLRGIFALMAEGTPAQDAELSVEIETMTGSCPDCGRQNLITRSRDFHCPVCHGTNVDWKGGNELYIASIEVQPITDQ